nr:hypothetical protein [Halomonas jincaotanensis]
MALEEDVVHAALHDLMLDWRVLSITQADDHGVRHRCDQPIKGVRPECIGQRQIEQDNVGRMLVKCRLGVIQGLSPYETEAPQGGREG